MKYLELDDETYHDILKMLETVMKFEEKQYDYGEENRYKESLVILERFKESVRHDDR